MHPVEDVRLVLSLIDDGLNDCQIERKTGISRRTVLGWRHGKVPRVVHSKAIRSCQDCGHPWHEFADLSAADYAYLLGIYLGDGAISEHPRCYRLNVFLDRKYQGVVAECVSSMRSVMPTSKVSIYQHPSDRMDQVYSYSRAWPCLFPQHGPGKKHLRRIELVKWQRDLVDRRPDRLIRGLIHSDGSRHLNTIKHPNKTYVYSRYEFTNLSPDIRRIFCDACDLLGIEWRRMNAKTISVARRGSVIALDRFVGRKR